MSAPAASPAISRSKPCPEEAAPLKKNGMMTASAYTAQMLASEWRETSAAALRAARACPYEALATQGHTLRTADFTATLAVEAAIHYLDMTVALPAAPRPDPASLALVRQVLDQLAGSPAPSKLG